MIPSQCSLADEIFVFKVPANEGLGAKEHDFSNVTTSMVSKEGELLPKQPNVEYFGTGKLGTLKGGLCNAMDFRKRMSNEDIAVLAETSVEQTISTKRTDYGFFTPRKINMERNNEVWNIIFLSKWMICRFHVNLPGCSCFGVLLL